jgi:ABC-type dipeptide/oligopeptide/nickel transport system permease component
MGQMKELVTPQEIHTLFIALAIGCPVIGIIAGAWFGARKNSLQRYLLSGFLIGLVGPLNLLLWEMYNEITNRLGLDTVRNLLVNLALFVALGLIAGILYGYISARTRTSPSKEQAAISDKDV